MITIKKPRPFDCCNDVTNIEIQRPKKDLVIEVCKVCKRRHFQLKLDPGSLTTAGKEQSR